MLEEDVGIKEDLEDKVDKAVSKMRKRRHLHPDGEYDGITKIFHWLMAIAFSYMLVAASLRAFAKDSMVYDLIWPYHSQVGFIILVMGVFRTIWLMKRLLSGYDPRTMLIAKIIHLSMYPVMIAIPLLALGRTYGAGRGFEFFSIPIFKADPSRDIEALVTLGNAYHGLLGWILFATIFGHIFAVIVHHIKKDPILRKIT